MDILGFGYAIPELYGETVRKVLMDDSVDLLLAIYLPSFQPEIRVPAQEMIEAVKEYKKQIVVVLNSPLIKKPKEVFELENAGIPVFFDPESGARASATLVYYYTKIRSTKM